jgi:hypothetical protein
VDAALRGGSGPVSVTSEYSSLKRNSDTISSFAVAPVPRSVRGILAVNPPYRAARKRASHSELQAV